MIDKARLDRIRNYQSTEFWAILFHRPMAILLLWVVADWRIVTPNRLTLASIALTLASAGLIAFGGRPEHIAAAIVINLGQALDNADGTLARYRQSGTNFGGFLDKVGDCVGIIAVFTAISWAAYLHNHDARTLLLGPVAAGALILRGYAKWVYVAQSLQKAARDGRGAGSIDAQPVPPPRRTAAAWARLIGKAIIGLPQFEEVDLSFWIALCLLLNRLGFLALLLCATQVAGCLVMTVKRGVQSHRLDQKV